MNTMHQPEVVAPGLLRCSLTTPSLLATTPGSKSGNHPMSLSGFVQLVLSTGIFLVAASVAKSWALAPGTGKLVLTLALYSLGNLIMLRLVREFGMATAFSLS